MSQARWSLLLLVLSLACCGAPFLVAAVLASGAGAWLAANRLFFAAGVALAVSAVAAGFWIQQRRRIRQRFRRTADEQAPADDRRKWVSAR